MLPLPPAGARQFLPPAAAFALALVCSISASASAGAQVPGDSATPVRTVPISRTTAVPLVRSGASIGTIDLVSTPAPVSDSLPPGATWAYRGAPDFSTLLQDRLPGLSVLRSSGAVAEGSRVRTRGPVSAFADEGPMLIVDGIRVASEQSPPGLSSAPVPSRLDDLAPEEIDHVDVLRGPAAAALFGPGAASGVIVVTTRRGRPGPLRWNAHAGSGLTMMPDVFPANYQMSGISTSTGAPVANCTLLDRMRQSCTPTTLSVWNPLEQASPFQIGRSTDASAALSGGFFMRAPLTFRLGGGLTRDGGVTSDDESRRDHLHGALGQQLRVPVLGAVALDASAAYVRRTMLLPTSGYLGGPYNPIAAGLLGQAVDDTAHGYATDLFGPAALSSGGNADHFTGTLGAHVTPFSWLDVAISEGHDRVTQRESRVSDQPPSTYTIETQEVGHDRHDVTSLDFTIAASYTPVAGLRTRSTAALEQEWSRDSTFQGAFTHYVNSSGPSGSSYQWSRARSRQRGMWFREALAWRDRLFVNGGARWDHRWLLGFNDALPVEPSVDVSWVARQDTAGSMVRLRSAYGRVASEETQDLLAGADPFVAAQPHEYMTEYETGLDATFHQRASLALTYYREDTHELLFPSAAGAPQGLFTYGSGRMHTSGVEALLRADLLRHEQYRWDAALSIGTTHNNVDALGGQNAAAVSANAFGQRVLAVGHPYGGYSGVGYTFTDANHNGQVDSTEVRQNTQQLYHGNSLPSVNAALRSQLVIHGNLTFAAALGYEGGQQLVDYEQMLRCRVENCRGLVDPSASLQDQAAAYYALSTASNVSFLENASFAKLREVSVTWSPRATWARERLRGASISIIGRNLATWTRYRGLDPEITTIGAEALPRFDAATRPIPRQLAVQLDFGV